MSFIFEGNGYFDGSVLTNSSTSNNIITTSVISACSIDMLSSTGNFTRIINVRDPLFDQDAATKIYVDSLGIRISNVSLSSKSSTLISNNVSGSYVITVKNLVLNGPSAVFNVTKNEASQSGQVFRNVASPGTNTKTTLEISWPANTGILLNKTGVEYDGSYMVKIM